MITWSYDHIILSVYFTSFCQQLHEKSVVLIVSTSSSVPRLLVNLVSCLLLSSYYIFREIFFKKKDLKYG